MSDKPTESSPATDETQEATESDIQAKMKAALERKHAAEKAGQAHLDAHSANQQTHGKSGGGRQFRRKAGG